MVTSLSLSLVSRHHIFVLCASSTNLYVLNKKGPVYRVPHTRFKHSTHEVRTQGRSKSNGDELSSQGRFMRGYSTVLYPLCEPTRVSTVRLWLFARRGISLAGFTRPTSLSQRLVLNP